MGCLGRGHSDSLRASSSSFVPAVIPGNDADNTMASLNSNSHHVLVLKADGSVAGWGAAGGGRLAGHGEAVRHTHTHTHRERGKTGKGIAKIDSGQHV